MPHPEPVALREPAPAKLNLALHVRRRRDDGYHDLETIFAFCTDGDWLTGREADDLTLDIHGPMAKGLTTGEDNLVLKAANALREAAKVTSGASLRLDKRLPVASGIGGGSADAAAALRLLTALWGVDPAIAAQIAPRLGADVPACLLSMAARGEGVGDKLKPVELGTDHDRPVLLVNPRVAVSTPKVFAKLEPEDRGPLGDDWRIGRNDLEPAAIALAPQIAETLDWLRQCPGVEIARMSGSGATCFALFDEASDLDAAAKACPDKWWHLTTRLR